MYLLNWDRVLTLFEEGYQQLTSVTLTFYALTQNPKGTIYKLQPMMTLTMSQISLLLPLVYINPILGHRCTVVQEFSSYGAQYLYRKFKRPLWPWPLPEPRIKNDHLHLANTSMILLHSSPTDPGVQNLWFGNSTEKAFNSSFLWPSVYPAT